MKKESQSMEEKNVIEKVGKKLKQIEKINYKGIYHI